MANYARLEAKRSSGIPMVLYNERMRQEALLCQELNGKLEEALTNGEIEVWHQAKVDMSTGCLLSSAACKKGFCSSATCCGPSGAR